MSAATGLAILFPALDAATKPIRSVHDPAYAEGLPPHITVLFPFLNEEDITETVRVELLQLFATHPPISSRFVHLGQFPGVSYLKPEHPDPFILLTKSVLQAFPDYPPYEGAFDVITPHLTLAQSADFPTEMLSSLDLPLEATADAVSHLALRQGRWYEIARYPLAATGARR